MEPLMGLLPRFRLLSMALLLLVGSGATVLAQSGYPQHRNPRAYPPGYYPGKLVQPAQPQQGFSLRRFFGIPDDPPPQARTPVTRPRRTAAPPPVVKQPRPKPNPTVHLVVFGDSLADYAGQGLDDIYAENSDVAVIRKTRAEGGLVRSSSPDWPTFIRETIDGGQKITIAVVMLGINDRQSIKDGEVSREPLSERWQDLYRLRVDDVLRVFQERAIPVVWIGLPPVKNTKVSEDASVMNEIFRESVQRHGGAYVDVWPGFVDEENRYTASGPDVDGEPARLRTSDGVLFTAAGARKLAHFAETDIKRLIEERQPGAMAAIGSDVDPIEAAIPSPPDVAAPVALPVKPLVGPVLPLTKPDVTPSGTLISSAPKLNGDHAYAVQRAFRTGAPPSPRPGRADDFRWPQP